MMDDADLAFFADLEAATGIPYAVQYLLDKMRPAAALSNVPARDLLPAVGLIKIEAGDEASEDGFDCDAHLDDPAAGAPRPALEVGTADRPIGPEHTAVIRLSYVEGMDR